MKKLIYLILPILVLIGCSSDDNNKNDFEETNQYVIVKSVNITYGGSTNGKQNSQYEFNLENKLNTWIDCYVKMQDNEGKTHKSTSVTIHVNNNAKAYIEIDGYKENDFVKKYDVYVTKYYSPEFKNTPAK
ncbi:hypothetical protein ACPDHQ_16785 [Myroides odoratimimus]|uniref:hypothetical protein n=1 Tax=Myroides odoratimimus TaxID=76832 RepID=UPI003D2F5AC9